jgi:signal transduction histidine kinase
MAGRQPVARVSRLRHSPVAWTVGGLGVIDIAVAAVLSALVILVAAGRLEYHGPRPSDAAFAGVFTMVLPVAWRRPWPLAVAAVLAVAALANGLLLGPAVRCGVALPVLFLVAYAVAVRCDRVRSKLGLLLCLGGVIAEGFSDPHIEAGGLILIVPLTVGFYGAGLVVRARSQVAESLRTQSAQLRLQREQTAHLAVLADRAQISAELEQTLHARLDGIATAAASGLDLLDREQADEGAAREVMAAIERDGREALGRMRAMVGTLHEPAPSEPQPTLARLPELLATATTASARLSVEGSPRTLPAGLELSSYRIVEHLIGVLEDEPGAVVEVRLKFCPDAIELHVRGPQSPTADLRALLAAAAERAYLHAGTVQHRIEGRTCHATARLPLISGHA